MTTDTAPGRVATPRGTCPTCLTNRSLTASGQLRNHTTTANRLTHCPGSGALALVGDRIVARAKALAEARADHDYTIRAANAALDRARRAHDHTIRGARTEYERVVRTINERYGAGAEPARW